MVYLVLQVWQFFQSIAEWIRWFVRTWGQLLILPALLFLIVGCGIGGSHARQVFRAIVATGEQHRKGLFHGIHALAALHRAYESIHRYSRRPDRAPLRYAQRRPNTNLNMNLVRT